MSDIRVAIGQSYALGHLCRMCPGSSPRATFSLSRLTSRNLSSLDSLLRTLFMPTASTSMLPLLDPRTTFSFDVSSGISTYFEESACRNERPRVIDALGRMKDPEFGILEMHIRRARQGSNLPIQHQLAGKIMFVVFGSVMFSPLRIVPFYTQPKSFCSIDLADKSDCSKS